MLEKARVGGVSISTSKANV